MKRLIKVLVIVVGLLAIVPAVFAGGWATVTLDELPGEVHAGEPFTIGFVVLQHGVTPVQSLGPKSPIKPLITATSADGVRVEFEAAATPKPGHFQAEVTLPNEGQWAWSITPAPFAEQVLEPLTVLPAVQAAATAALPGGNATGGLAPMQSALRLGGIGLIAIGLLVYLWQRRRPVGVPQVEG